MNWLMCCKATRRQIGHRGAHCVLQSVLALIACGPAFAQSIADVPIEPQVVMEDRSPERSHTYPNGVTGLADVVYSVIPGYRPLILDLYLPPGAGNDGKRYPLVMYIHGGGWMGGHTRNSGAFADWPSTLARIAREGYVVASVEYRLSGEAPFPAAFDDVRTAIRWLRGQPDKFGLDPQKAVVWGASAGGQLAGLVGTACGSRAYPESAAAAGDGAAGNPELASACVQGVIVFYGVFDFSNLVPTTEKPGEATVPGVLGAYLNCSESACDPAVVAAASPITFVDANDPPFLFVHGVEDPVVSIEQSKEMQAKLKEAGVPATLIAIPGVKHSFIGETGDETVAASRKAFDAAIEFIRKTLDSN